MSNPKNILIVGGGLAGSVCAAELCAGGNKVTLVDAESPRAASRIAAGLFNIITGKNAGCTWQGEAFLQSMNEFWDRPAFKELRDCVQFRTIYRPFRDPFDFNEWASKSADLRFDHLVSLRHKSRKGEFLRDPWGGLDILPCGWVDTTEYLARIRKILSDGFPFRYYNALLDYACINPESGEVSDCEFAGTYDHIVFAEGIQAKSNPFFTFLDLRPLKGQIMDVKMDAPEMEYILSRKVFVIPKGNGIYTVGSTYELKFDDWEPNEAGIAEISGSLSAAVKIPFEVIQAYASVRPTSPNRKPILGRHPQYPKLMIVNGLGTKGVLQSPWCAQMTGKIISGELDDLPKEISVTRFCK